MQSCEPEEVSRAEGHRQLGIPTLKWQNVFMAILCLMSRDFGRMKIEVYQCPCARQSRAEVSPVGWWLDLAALQIRGKQVPDTPDPVFQIVDHGTWSKQIAIHWNCHRGSFQPRRVRQKGAGVQPEDVQGQGVYRMCGPFTRPFCEKCTICALSQDEVLTDGRRFFLAIRRPGKRA